MAKGLEERVMGLIRGDRLVRRGDKVMVAVSGGKDSAVAAWILAKHAEELGIEVALLHLDQQIHEYSSDARKTVEKLAKQLSIPLYVHEWRKEWGTGLGEIAEKLHKAPCHICGVLKRYYQNIIPKKLGYNVVATGHNLDDSVGFIINNLINGQIEYIAKLAPMLPETELTVRKIKPLFWIQEWEIRKFADEHSIPYTNTRCPFQQFAPTYHIRRSFDVVEEKRPGTRKAFVKNVMKLARAVKKVNETKKPKACKYCGAPTNGDVCAVCKMKIKLGLEPGKIVLPEVMKWN